VTDQPPIPPPLDPAYEQADLPPPREPMFRVPPVTAWLIAINVLVHAVRQVLPAAQDDLVIGNLAFDTGAPLSAQTFLTLLTYQFLHADWMHLGVNMITLLAFGAGLERVLPRLWYLGVYLLGGIGGALFEAVTASGPDDEVLLGASASISALFGALIIVMGLNRLGPRPVSLFVIIALVLVPMVVMGVFNIGSGGLPVAWRAHVGGFTVGLIAGWGLLALHHSRARR
jgi:membrane associated rhomboid family serine protease